MSKYKYPALETYLVRAHILEEERDMWRAQGFYIFGPDFVLSTDGTRSLSGASYIVDHTGTRSEIIRTLGDNLRSRIIEEWREAHPSGGTSAVRNGSDIEETLASRA